jgi:hypothetical protein
LRTVLASLAVGLALSGCSLGPSGGLLQTATGDQGRPVEINRTPFFPQETHQCGPAALATVLTYAGKQITPAQLTDQVYLPSRKGSLQVELLGATRRQGLLPYPISPDVDGLLGELHAGRPVLVLMNLGVEAYPLWHYAVVIGHDPGSGTVILRSGSTRRKLMSARRFRGAWGRGGSWGMVVLSPGDLPAKPDRSGYLEAVAALEAAGQPRAAEAAYRAGLGPWPEDPVVLLGISNSLYGQGDSRGAEQGYRRLLAGYPTMIPAYNNLAQVLLERGQTDQARAVIVKGLSLTPQGHPLRLDLKATQAEIGRRASGPG